MNSKDIQKWKAEQIHCPNCGTVSIGYKDEEGKVRFKCNKCGLVMVRTMKSRRTDMLEMVIPKGMVRI